MKETVFDADMAKNRSWSDGASDGAVQLRDGGFGWFGWCEVEERRDWEDNPLLPEGEFASVEWEKCSDCDGSMKQCYGFCVTCQSIAVPLWDGTFALAEECKIHHSGEFFLLAKDAAKLLGGGFAHMDEVVQLANGGYVIKPENIPMEENAQTLEKLPGQKEKNPPMMRETNTGEELPGEPRDALQNNLHAAKEAILRCTVERDSSLAEYAHLFAQRLEQQVISVIEDGLEALSIYEEAGSDLDEETKKRLLNYVQLALKFKGLEESS